MIIRYKPANIRRNRGLFNIDTQAQTGNFRPLLDLFMAQALSLDIKKQALSLDVKKQAKYFQ